MPFLPLIISNDLHRYGSATDPDLRTLGEETVRVAQELKLLLQKLRDQGNRSKPWAVFRQTFTTIWKREDIEKLESRMVAIRDELQFHTVVSIKTKLDAQSIRLEDVAKDLDQQTQNVIPRLFGQLDHVKSQNDTIIDHQIRNEDVSRHRHQELMSSVHDVLRIGGKSAPKEQAALEEKELLELIQSTIPVSLWFPTMQEREDTIHGAYQQTYEWLFCDPVREQKPWVNFHDFLVNDGTTYWITGKAGSGKSTLMKYALNNWRTQKTVSKWAGKQPIFASFYFYYKGTKLQKSETGVLRGLLHEILFERRDLITVAFPERSQAIRANGLGGSFEPTYWELKRALETLVRNSPDERFFITVDGLDEYEASTSQMGQLVDVFISLSTLSNVKTLLSSRPWVVFEERFAACPRLRLHELTRPDIINKFPGNNSVIDTLKKDIVNHSDGVFLWVYLVVRSLLEGLTNRDSVDELRDRFLELPTDLENLYQHMWDRIPKRYQAQAARLLRLLATGTADGARTSLLGLGLQEDFSDDAIDNLPIAPLQEQDVSDRMASMKTRLASRCIGLMEVYHSKALWVDKFTPSLDSDCYPNEIENKSGYPSVRFLHRTVFEFVSEPDIAQKLVQATAPKGSASGDFQPEVVLLRLVILRIRTYCEDDLNKDCYDGGVFPISLEALAYYAIRTCRRAERASGKAQTRLLMELDKTMMHLYTKVYDGADQGHWYNGLRLQGEVGEYEWLGVARQVWKNNDLLALAVRHGLIHSVADHPSLAEVAKTKPGRPLLDHALRPSCTLDGYEKHLVLRPSSEMVKLLLEKGAKLDQTFNGQSLIESFLGSLKDATEQFDYPGFTVETPKIILLLLEKTKGPEMTTDDIEAMVRLLKPQYASEEEDAQELKTDMDKAVGILCQMHDKRRGEGELRDDISMIGQGAGLFPSMEYAGGGLVVPAATEPVMEPVMEPVTETATKKPKGSVFSRMRRAFRRP
ncbi:hypothetical protein B0T10DRAFT_574190 [Thelonectria olida]|uniref:NACHT domain-containing protein n=1 Tax=Thelonectria olida TaxID=1576542 RepID=A0A9P8W2U8_9HYPO|nr:hypothetical protein B0T10DRAFT_574190 [Thelonectria olida]